MDLNEIHAKGGSDEIRACRCWIMDRCVCMMPLHGPSRRAAVDAEDGRKREGLEDIRRRAPRTLLSMP